MAVAPAHKGLFPRLFFLTNYGLLLVVTGYIAHQSLMPWEKGWNVLFTLAALFGYAFVYLLPTLLMTALAWWLLPRPLARVLAVLLASAVLMLLIVDSQVYRLYGFHINGFVWNLMVTPGGIASMGGSDGTVYSVGLVCLAIVVLEAALMALSVHRRGPVLRWWLVATVLLGCMLGERFVYGLSHLNGYRPVLAIAHEIPLYQPATFASVAKDLGYQVKRRTSIDVTDSGRLQYPLNALQRRDNPPSPNVLFLVAESLRGDMLTPEIMPNLWRFASQHGRRYSDHFSGGNGTRMGIFSLFYGLPGNYWFSFLNARKPPLLISEMQRRDYRFGLYTSARFSYPEFDKTVFSGVPQDVMVSDDTGQGWQRDRRNVARLLDFLHQDGNGRPFFGFMFFESPHARYYFPEESVIRSDYLADFNYATMDVHEDMPRIFNRYINSVHHLDQQLGRVIDELESSGQLDNTLVVITGDHGEEFMEHGRWGHNSEFHDEQVHVPLVIAGPGIDPAVVNLPTSHLDVAPTVMQRLGVTSPSGDYAVGVPLDQVSPDRYRLAASWDAVAYMGQQFKIAMPMNAGGLAEMSVSRADDEPVADEEAVFASEQTRLARVLRDMSRFYRK
ncbi:DUF3413 domain-containing protein [Alloalcanivorax mobilis]|uniref:DUF3413 domain-containing protein n=1 Tax=Alloalcanivorax mobilis TaxID=2019569 RepID=UPI000C793369|nr:sulfatase-like hydrolase/transferase [Alloalcanivorax mobilis]